MTDYKPHYACFECRKSFKRRLLKDVARDEEVSVAAKCPECGSFMANMGLDFKASPKDELKAWQHLRSLYQVGITFHSCGCSGPGYVPADATALAKVLLERKDGYVRNLRFWLNKSELASRKELELDRQANASQYGWVHQLQGRKGGVVAKDAVAYWTEQVHNIEHNIGKVLAAIS